MFGCTTHTFTQLSKLVIDLKIRSWAKSAAAAAVAAAAAGTTAAGTAAPIGTKTIANDKNKAIVTTNIHKQKHASINSWRSLCQPAIKLINQNNQGTSSNN